LADDGLAIDEGTLYPLLRRLETQGLLVSQWREEDKRNKRFYRLSPEGETILKQLLEEWESINASLGKNSADRVGEFGAGENPHFSQRTREWCSGAVWLTHQAGEAGDPSLRLKNGYAQDDKVV